ncbi:MAG TPA: hypothetical protein VF172_08160 [Nitrososphaera sp.]
MRTTPPSVGLAFGSGAIGLGAILLATTLMPAIYPSVPDYGGASEQFLQLHGRLDLMLYDEYGNLKDERHLDNLIVDTGFEGVAYRISPHDGSAANDPWNYIAIGTGTDAPAADDTALSGSEVARLQDATATYTSAPSKQLQLQVSFGPGVGTGTIAESGLFNAESGGTMLARQTFAAITKGTSDTLTVTWTITLSGTG